MGFALGKLGEYHRTIGLNVSLYHVDPFWYSQEPLDACTTGPYAKNLTASPWAFPDGLRALGLPMMLFLQGFDPHTVYRSPPFSYAWAGQSVAGHDAARFFAARFAELTSGRSQCSALTLDGLQGVFYSAAERCAWSAANQTHSTVCRAAISMPSIACGE